MCLTLRLPGVNEVAERITKAHEPLMHSAATSGV